MIPLPFALPAIPWRLVGAVAAVVAVALMGWRVSVWRDGYERVQATEKALEMSQAEAQQCFVREESAWQALRQAEGKAKEREAADKATAERIERDLQTRLSAADARGRDLARRLSNATRACPGAVSGAAGAAGDADGASGDAGRDEAVAGVFAACERDAERLNRWQAWWLEVNRR